MCDLIKDIDGDVLPHIHEHEMDKGKITKVYFPEEPDREDWEELKKILRNKDMVFSTKPKMRFYKS